MKRLAYTLLLSLVVLGVVAYAMYRSDLATVRERLLAGSEIADTACGPIEYRLSGSGPAVLAIHGSGGGYHQVESFARYLAQAGYQVIAMSRFGYLRTPMPADASAQAQADAHACLLDTLGIRSAAVFGASAGAPSAMQFCLRHAERCSAMVLLVPVTYSPGRTAADTTPPSPFASFVLEHVLSSDFTIWAITRLAPGMLVETALATPGSVYDQADPDEQLRALDLIRDIFPVSAKLQGLANDSAIAATIPRYALEELTAPTLLISLQDDLYGTYVGARYSAQHLPNATMIGYARGGHGWLGHDTAIKAEIGAFLSPRSRPQTNPHHQLR
jgi:2-hydroxy-6-oxonona-2,4-dienedioate hydrolase